jgi:hypothetical protein
MKIINRFFIVIIKSYKYLISPYFAYKCRYQPTCSEYFMDSLELNGTLKGCLLGMKRILRCHPIKALGGSSGYDPAPNLKKGKK